MCITTDSPTTFDGSRHQASFEHVAVDLPQMASTPSLAPSPDCRLQRRETDKTGVAGRTSQRPNHSIGQSFEVRGESVSRLIVGSIVVSMTCGREGSGMVPELWSKL